MNLVVIGATQVIAALYADKLAAVSAKAERAVGAEDRMVLNCRVVVLSCKGLFVNAG